MALEVNTRKYKRYPTKLRVKLNSGRLSFWAITSDISKKGLRIRVNQDFPVNKILDLELIMPDGQVSFISGVVRYVNETPYSEEGFGVGIEIIYDDTTFKDYLKDLEEKAGINSQESDITQPLNQIVDESREQTDDKEKEQEFVGFAPIPNESEMCSETKSYKHRDKKIQYLSIFLIILAIGIVVSGIHIYKNVKQDIKVQQMNNLICSIQIGAFTSEANAQILSRNYKEKGYEVFIEKSAIKDKGVMYKVLIGPFKNLEDTSHLAMDIRKKENINTFVVCK